MVYNLLSKLKEEQSLKIIALSLNEGILASKLKDAGIETYVIPEKNNSFAKVLLKAFNLLKKRKIDIIHSHRYKENILALLLSKTTGVKRLITTMHGLSEPPSTLTSASTLTYERNANTPVGLKTKIDYYILNNHFTRVVAVSQEMKNTLIQKYGFKEEKVEVIYNGIPLNLNLDLSLNLKSNGAFHIGTVGRMVPVKDFNLFLEIAAELKKQVNSQSAIRNPKFDNVRFSILGDGPLKEQLTQKAKDLKIQNCVEFMPPRPDPFPYYQSLDLYLNTSLHEGIPLSILEAMACKKPVVAPKVGGMPEIISDGENGVLVEVREPKKFADSCLKLIQYKDMRFAMGDKASKRIAAYFSNSKMAEGYQRLYLELTPQPQTQPQSS
ncbi:MAG: glycosyltransferase [Nitrospirae bacterium]|nr:glycosyltransferase [Nitrospirota bacterium]